MNASSNLDTDKKTESLQTCIDIMAMMSQASREMSIERRGFSKAVIQPEFKDLCNKTRPITKSLFGDNVTQDMKDIKLINKLSNRKPYNPSSYHGNRSRSHKPSFLGRGRGRSNNQRRAPPTYSYRQYHGSNAHTRPARK